MSRYLYAVIQRMVFLPRTWLERNDPAPKFASLHAQIMQVVLLFLLVGGWSVISEEWIGVSGIRGFATFAFLILMALLFYGLGRAYGKAERALMYVYCVPSLFFLTAVVLFLSTDWGAVRLRELLTGEPITAALGPSIFLGLLALIVFGFSFFQLGTARFHPWEIVFTLFLMAWTAFLLLGTSFSGLYILNSVLSIFMLMILIAVAHYRKETWLMGYVFFFASAFAVIKLFE